MSEHNDNERDAEAIDTGEPITALRELEEPASDNFMEALNRRIQRRLLVTDVSRLTWSGPVLVIIEFFKLIFELIGAGGTDQEKE
jgi:hypothetical protein